MNLNGLKIKILALLLLAAVSNMVAGAESTIPDFAYPRQVSQQAEKDLATAVKSGDGAQELRSLVNYATAQNMITSDNMNDVLAKIAEVADREKDVANAAMLKLLLADVYERYYKNCSWKFDQREMSLESYPDDVAEWSGEHFKAKIKSLYDGVLSKVEPLKVRPLSDYKDALTGDNISWIYYPTVYDLVAYKAIDFYNGNGDALMVSQLFDSLENMHRGDGKAALINAQLNRLKYVSDSDSWEDVRSASIYRSIYETNFGHTEYCCDALLAYYQENTLSVDDKKWAYDQLQLCIDKYPAYWRKANMVNCMKNIERVTLNCSTPTIVAPSHDFVISFDNSNADKYSYRIYKVNEPTKRGRRRFSDYTSAVLVKKGTMTCDMVVPFETKQQVTVSVDAEGYYCLVVLLPGEDVKKSGYYYEILSTSIYGVIGENRDVKFALAVNPATGEPVQAANVVFQPNTTNSVAVNVGQTDDIGFKVIEPKASKSVSYGTYTFSKGQSTYVLSGNYPTIAATSDNRQYVGQGYTSLSLYHPGDSVDWAFVVATKLKKSRNVARDEQFTVEMRDANNQQIESKQFTSDAFGRVTGRFALPQDGLTGRFRVVLKREKSTVATQYFTVSDYKLPTYSVNVIAVKKNSPAVGAVTVEGKAVTYSGFPIIDADVNVQLMKCRRVGFRMYNEKIISTQQVKSDDNGKFTVTFPSDVLDAGTCFKVVADVTAQSGETQSCSSNFVTGKPYSVVIQNLNSIIDVTNFTALDVTVLDEKGESVALPLNYQLVKDKETVKNGAIQTGKSLVDWSAVPAGTYQLKVQPADTTLSDAQIATVVIYRPTDEQIAKETPLWIPRESYSVDSKKVRLLYGTYGDNEYVYSFVSADSTITSRKCEKVNHGYHYLDVELVGNQACVTLFVVKDLKVYTGKIFVSRNVQSDDIKVVAESFRDKIVPNATETWKFTVKNAQGRGVRSAMMVDMYNKALDAVQPHVWSTFGPMSYYLGASQFSMSTDLGLTYNFTLNGNLTSLTTGELIRPSINDYNKGYGLSTVRVRGGMKLLTSAKAESGATDDVEVEAMAVEAVADMANAMDAGEEIADEEDVQEAEAEQEVYRDSEVQLGLYRPCLTTNADGDIEISFTVPNANTTWVVQAVAWTEDVKMAKLMKEVVASKPIMVSVNAPRFVRVGDKVQIVSTVMNNSDETRDIQVVTEVFNPVTGAVLTANEQAISLTDNASTTVSVAVDVPSAISTLGVRVKAGDNSYRDGEQVVIPVHEALSPIVETTTFYMPSSTNTLDVQLTQVPENARVTLEFCENPQWAIVTALPGLRKDVGRDANSAAAAICSGAFARGIIKSNPAIVAAIKQWQSSNNSDSVLVSMLQKNEDLKIALLNATPWMQDAQDDTERMARLSLLFDDNELNSSVKVAIDVLEKLETTTGGWAWTADARNKVTSYWATLNVLAMLGELNQAGLLPDDKKLALMIDNAVQYLDNKTVEMYDEAKKKGEYSQYVYVRDLFPDKAMSLSAKQVRATTIQYLVKNWKNASVGTKAIWAKLLYNHQYQTVAKSILQSLREFTDYTPQKGRWFPSLYDAQLWSYSPVATTALVLDVFATIEPDCEEIEQFKQWIILQKIAENWGTSISTTRIIATLFSQTKMQLGEASQFAIKIGEVDVQPENLEKMTGYFRKEISGLATQSSTLNIVRDGTNPSYGAVYYQYDAHPATVKAGGCEEITIDKTLLVQRNNADGVTWVKTSEYAVGDKVKTQYTIKTTRDLQYVTIIDERAATLEPIDQLPGYIFSDGTCFYRENRDQTTDLFITYLPKGVYILTVDATANNAGEFTSGVVTAQSQYAPQMSAHSAGGKISVK